MSEYYWDNKIEEVKIDRKYDIAMCHAFLLHMSDSKKVLQKNDNSYLTYAPNMKITFGTVKR